MAEANKAFERLLMACGLHVRRYSAPAIPHMILSLCVMIVMFAPRCAYTNNPGQRCSP